MLVSIFLLLSVITSAAIISNEQAAKYHSLAPYGSDAASIILNDTTASIYFMTPNPRCNAAQFGRGLDLADCQTLVTSLPDSAVSVTFGVRYDGTGRIYERILPLRWLSCEVTPETRKCLSRVVIAGKAIY